MFRTSKEYVYDIQYFVIESMYVSIAIKGMLLKVNFKDDHI